MARSASRRVGVIGPVQFAAALAIVLWPAGGWAQSADQVAFTLDTVLKFEAHPVPAKVTGETDSALTSEGYFAMGTIRASQAGKKENPDITAQLKSAILQKAAEVGGDVVRFSKEGTLETTEVPTGKTRHMRSCIGTEVPLTNRGYGGPTQCVGTWNDESLPIKQWKKSLVSEGTVWRKLAASDVNFRGKVGRTPLHIAAADGRKEVVELLLAHGADVNARNGNGHTPLSSTAYPGCRDVAELLLTHGADVNAKDDVGETPLHNAATTGQKDAAELFLAHGADVNAKDNVGMTPLHRAAEFGKREVAEVLLAHAADVNAKDNRGYTPLHWATEQALIDLLRQHDGHE